MNLIITYFDQLYGPTVYWSYSSIDDDIAEKIKNFIDLDLGDQFFELSMVEKNIKTINLYIEIPSGWGRGRKEMALMTVIVDHNYKASLFQDIMRNTFETLKNAKEMYKAFYKDDSKRSNDPDVLSKYEELNDILTQCIQELEEMIKNANIGTILFLGISKVGKSTILERLRKNAFNPNTKPTLTTTLMQAMIGSYNFKVVDVSGQKGLRYQWWSYTTNPDAVIFVLDINETAERVEETKFEFKKLQTRFEKGALSEVTPVLICANKIDLHEDPRMEVVQDMLELTADAKKFKVLLTSAKTGEGIEEGFKWLVNKLIQFS